jgi:Zn-dependent peptidase ImmA (M78 family)
MSRLTANINPALLIWARQTAGYESHEIALKLGISEAEYLSWERSGTNIPFGKLKSISTYYKRQVAAFFLQEIPEKKRKPNDYRNLSTQDSKFSRKMLLTLRRAYQIQEAALELEGEFYWKEKSSWVKELETEEISISKKSLINWLRNKIELNIEHQISIKDPRVFYNHIRKQIEEKLGILILQFSFPMNEAHGFSLINANPFVIVTNSNHTYTGRVFTILHELAHILNHQSGICFIEQYDTVYDVEVACNTFAAEFLVPDEYVVSVDSLSQISHYSNKLNVSREAYLRRVKEKGLVSNSSFFEFLAEIHETYANIKNQGGYAPPELKSKASRGPTFFNLVLEGIAKNKINYSEASQLLDLRINRIINEL